MSPIKVCVIGAGSYVFGPSILHQCICENRLSGLEIYLHDVDGAAVSCMEQIGRRMAEESGVAVQLKASTDRRESLAGAAFVVYSAAPQLARNFQIDCEIIEQFSPGGYKGEFGGIAGISYSLRQIELLESVAADMRELCPQAVLCCTANPLPRLIQAAHELGVKAVGFCSASSGIYSDLWQLFGGEAESFPWPSAHRRWKIQWAGVNHFTWLLSVQDRQTGEDVYPEIRSRIAAGQSMGSPRAEAFLKKWGVLLLPNDHHTRDFLEAELDEHAAETPAHGTPIERGERQRMLQGAAEGRIHWRELVQHPSWERIADLIGAMAFNQPAEFVALNLINQGQLPQLPPEVVVETPAHADASGIHPVNLPLPEAVLPITRRAADVSHAIVRAALDRDRTALWQAVEMDPTIRDKASARRAVEVCLIRHLKNPF